MNTVTAIFAVVELMIAGAASAERAWHVMGFFACMATATIVAGVWVFV